MNKNTQISTQWSVADIAGLSPIVETIASNLQQYRILLLKGDLGAGKTTTMSHLIKHLGSKDEVSSPSYSLINEYKTPSGRSVYHMDMYRLETIEEALDIGIEEYLYSDGICLIEWPGLIMELIDEPYLELSIRLDEDGVRIFTLTSSETWETK